VVACGLATAREDEGLREAMHRLDPDLALIVVADRPAAEPLAGAHRTIVGDRDSERSGRLAADLAAALEIPIPNAEEGRQSHRPVAATEPGSDRSGSDDSGAPPMRTPPGTDRRLASQTTGAPPSDGRRERDVVDLVIGDALEAFAARSGRTPTPRPVPDPAVAPEPVDAPVALPATNLVPVALGDIDLVDAVRRGGELLLARAVAIVRSELGSADIRFVPAAAEERCDEGDGEPVEHDGRRFGRLASHDCATETLRPWAEWLGHWLALERDMRDLERLAYTDELTGAGSRRAFDRVLDETIADARRRRRTATLMFFDIDDFKLYNDRFGHEAGDAVLRETVALLRAVIRKGDRVFRVGGDEFVVLFADNRGDDGGPSTAGSSGIESVETIAHRFRDRVADLRLAQLGVDAPGTIGISAGIATYPWDGHDARSLLRHADALALQSKRSGKNAITFGPGAKDHCRGS
jgi:diguanylate cyclase (GGDEF)-like protein